MIAEPVTKRIENAVQEVNHHLDRNNSIKRWTNLCENELFVELASCIIGSRITFEKAKLVTELLKHKGLLTIQSLIKEPKRCENRVHNVLKQQKCLYSKRKARYIVRSGIKIYVNEHTSIKKILATVQDQYVARETLSKLCLGIGLKQASLFLRNIRYADNLAILDTHVINFLHIMGLTNGSHKALNRNQYLSCENQLRTYSKRYNTSVAQLDVSIWIVMRIISREFKWML